MGRLLSAYVRPAARWGGVWSVMVESQATSTEMRQAHPHSKTLRYFGVRGLPPRGSGTGHGEVGVLGHLLPAEKSWAGRANRLGGIAKLTLTSSIKPHFMEPCILSWCSRTSSHHCPPRPRLGAPAGLRS